MFRLLGVTLAIFAAISFTSATLEDNAVSTICKNKPYKFANLEDLKSFALLVDKIGCGKFEAYKISEVVVAITKIKYNNNVCSELYVDNLRYVAFSILESRNVPIAIQDFLKSHMLALSKVCKERLVENLLPTSEKFLAENNEARETLEKIVKNSGVLLVGSSNLKEVFTLKDLLLRQKETMIHMKDGSQLVESQKNCNKLKTVYADLILPVVKLNMLGFDYSSAELDDQVTKMESSNEDVAKWYSAMFVCEAINMIVVVGNQYTGDDSETRIVYDQRRGRNNLVPRYFRKSPFSSARLADVAPVDIDTLTLVQKSPEFEDALTKLKHSISTQVKESSNKLKKYVKQVNKDAKKTEKEKEILSEGAVALNLWAKDYIETLKEQHAEYYRKLVTSTGKGIGKGVGYGLLFTVGAPFLLILGLNEALRKALGLD